MSSDPRYWSPKLKVEHREDGSILMWQSEPLGDWARCLPDRLVHWATATPDAPYLARRGADGAWVKLSYREVLTAVRSVGSALLALGLGPDRPVLILSENSLEHAVMALAAQYVGVPYAPVSPAYSLMSSDHSKLKGIADLLQPGLIFAQDGQKFAAAIAAIRKDDVALAVVDNPLPGCLGFDALTSHVVHPQTEAAFEAITGDTVAKYLFTSGSTGSPKAVINTQKMMMSNMAMVADCFRFMQTTPPVVCDWAPWNHTASGNKVFNMVLTHGGTFYIDDGKPAPGPIAETIRNLREVSPTYYFTVPTGWDMLVREFEKDADLCRTFFADLDLMMYAGAGMAQHTWDTMQSLAAMYSKRGVRVVSGLGATETAPFALQTTEQSPVSGNIGVPARGVTLKLVPNQGKLEARLKAPSVSPGYYKDPEKTAGMCDEEGFYLLGDALRPADPEDFTKGFFFDGRVAENFKLRTGTWVAVGALRAALVNHFGPTVRDAVITGDNEAYLGALLFLNEAALRQRFEGSEPLAELIARADVRAFFQTRLSDFAKAQTGSATRVKRLILLSDPPDLDKGETTDKGSINQRAVKTVRADAVAAIYAGRRDVVSAD
jgi:feruloyl-CoA synthase